MTELQTRSFNSYYKLVKSELVCSRSISDESLQFFVNNLNDALPTNKDELALVKIIKDIYDNAPNLAYRLFVAEKNGMQKQIMYILWTNAWCITRHFGIDKIVKLIWNHKSNKYEIKLMEPESATWNLKKKTAGRQPSIKSDKPKHKIDSSIVIDPLAENNVEAVLTPALEARLTKPYDNHEMWD
jgi:hypothetical protein